jgi:hypothetical protein
MPIDWKNGGTCFSADGMGMMLARQIIAVIENSGSSQVEALAAIGMVRNVIPTLPISAVSGADEGFLQAS